MIYPTEQNIEILQDGTYEQDYIITQATKACTVNDATNVINCPCHKLVAGDRVAFSAENGDLPCGIDSGIAYFVIASGLTSGAFKISSTSGGAEVDFTIVSQTATYFVSKIRNLALCSFDADIRADHLTPILASMACSVLDPAAGTVRTVLTPAQTQALSAGDYVWDLKLKEGSTAFFYARGRATVVATSTRDI